MWEHKKKRDFQVVCFCLFFHHLFASYVLNQDWQKAWTNFLSLSSQHSSFHNNFVLKGHWAALEVVLEAFEKEAARVVKILVAELNVPDVEKKIKVSPPPPPFYPLFIDLSTRGT